jgi:hypothetical protein
MRANLVLLLAAAALSGCSPRPRTSHVNDPITIQSIASPAAAAGSSEPQLSVTGDRAILSWVETNGTRATLKFAERTGGGWSAPRDAASGSDWFLSWADVPSVARLDDGTLVAQWLQSVDPHLEAYDVRLAFSHDEGRTWAPPTRPHHDGTKTQHGFVSMFPLPANRIGLVWLDGRETAVPENDNMTVRAATFDRDGRQTDETLVDDRVCECCATAVAVTSDGPVAAFRDRSPKEVRDISVSRYVNGAWTPSTSVHDDGWTIDACPINGPAIAARGRDVVVGWFTAKDDQGQAFAAFSRDSAATFGAPIRLDDGSSLGRVAVAMLDEGAAAMWVEFASGRAELKVRRIDASGQRGASQTVAGINRDRASGNARLARHGRELLFAWTESGGGNSAVKTAVASHP